MPRRRPMPASSYSDQFHPKASSPVQPIRCVTEMSRPSGDMDLMTISREMPAHIYGRPPISRPKDAGIFAEDEGYSSANSRLSSSRISSNLNYHIPSQRSDPNNHHTGYENISRSVKSTLHWNDNGNNMQTSNSELYPVQQVKRYQKVDRNDFVKYIEFGYDTPVNHSLYGNDFVKFERKGASPVKRQGTAISLERSNEAANFDSSTMYSEQFKGDPADPLPTLTEMDAHLRSSIELK